MSVNAKMTAIADAIRGKTGGTSPLTLDQMAAQITSIASGGDGLVYDMGEFVLDADVAGIQTSNGIPHQLGEMPDFVLIWTDDFADLSAENVNPYGHNVSLGYCWLNGLFGMTQRLSSTANSDNGIFVGFYVGGGASYSLGVTAPTSASYMMREELKPNAEKIALAQLSSTAQKWKAGVTYKYFVSKAWWNVGGVANAK